MSASQEERALAEARSDEASKEVTTKVTPSRAKAIVALRLSGAGFTEIAQIEELANASAARRIYEETLAAMVGPKEVEKLCDLFSARLDRLLKAVWAKAINPKQPDQLAFIRTALSINDRIDALHGTAAPQKVEVYTPDLEKQREWLRQAADQFTPADRKQEEEIIDAVVVGDDEDRGEPDLD